MFIRSAALLAAIYGHGAFAATIAELSCEDAADGVQTCSNCVNPLTSSYQPESVANLWASACCTATECDADGTNCDTKKFCYIYSMVSGSNSQWASNLPSGGLYEETCTTGQLRQGTYAQLAWSLEGQCTTTNAATWLTAGTREWTGDEETASGTGCPDVWQSGAAYAEGATVSDSKGVVWTCKTGQEAHCSVYPPTLGTIAIGTYWDATASCTGTLTPTISPTFSGGTSNLVGCPEAYASGTTYEAGDQVSITRADGKQVIYQCNAFPHSQFCNDPAYEPGVNTGTLYEGKYLWQTAWTYVSGCSGTLTPTTSPNFASVPTDGCPEAYVDGTAYVSGDKVSIPSAMGTAKDFDKIFKCNQWPSGLYCSNPNYKPGTTYNGESLWKEAWTYEGGCTGTISPTTSPTFIGGTNSLDGCPEEFVSGNTYEEGDKVAVLNVAGASGDFGKVYECKAYPFSGLCGQDGYEPGTEDGKDAWKYDGGCTGTLTPTTSPTFPTPVSGCAEEFFSGNTYEAGDEVSVLNVAGENGDFGKTYRCKSWPYSGYCGQDGYEPGTEKGKEGWTYVSGCTGTLTPTTSPMFNAANVYSATVSGCPEEWTPDNPDYLVGTLVTVSKGTARGMVYRCKSIAVEGWCQSAGYEPGTATGAAAWELVGNCVGTIAPTTSPVAIDMTQSANACQFKKTLSDTDPDVYVVMTAAAWVKGGSTVAHGGNVGANLYTDGDLVRAGLTAKKCATWSSEGYCDSFSPFAFDSPDYNSDLSNKGWLDATCEDVASKQADGTDEAAFDDDEFDSTVGAPIFSSSGDMVVENDSGTAACVNMGINPLDFFVASPDVKGCQQCESGAATATVTYDGSVITGTAGPGGEPSGLGFPGTATDGSGFTYDSNTCTPCLPLTTSALSTTYTKKSVCSCNNGAIDPWEADGKQCQQCQGGKRLLGAQVYVQADGDTAPVCEECPTTHPYFYTKTATSTKKYNVCCSSANCSDAGDGTNAATCYAPAGICATAF